MAPSLSDGVPGLEGLHEINPPSPWTPVTLNDWMDPATGRTRQWTDQTAFTRLQKITGLHDKPDADDPRVNLVNQIGELAFPRQQRGKTIVYSGVIVGQTLSAMRNLAAALRAAVSSESSDPADWTLAINYDPTYDPTGMVWLGYGMPIAYTSDDVQGSGDATPSAFQRSFDLSFRLSDPRFWLAATTITLGVPTPIASGTSGTLVMTGTAPSEPTFTVTGTGSGSATILLQNTTISRQLQIILPAAMASGDTLVVNFFARTGTFTHAGGSYDYSGYIDWANTDWWGEAAASASLGVGSGFGANVLKVTGDSWSVSAVPAVW